MLQYMYTGSVTIRDGNVFDLFESFHFLQMKSGEDPLYEKIISFLIKKLESDVTIDAAVLVKVWNVGETYGELRLKNAVLEYLDCHFEQVIRDNLLAYLSFDEIYEILSRPRLCVRSLKGTCDAIVNWIAEKRCPDNEDDHELTLKLLMKLQAKFPCMSDTYWRKALQKMNIKLPKQVIGIYKVC